MRIATAMATALVALGAVLGGMRAVAQDASQPGAAKSNVDVVAPKSGQTKGAVPHLTRRAQAQMNGGTAQPGNVVNNGGNLGPAAAKTTTVPTMRARAADQEYRECLQIWDKGTHMTRAEWAATCRRVQNRLNTVTQQAQAMPGRRRVR